MGLPADDDVARDASPTRAAAAPCVLRSETRAGQPREGRPIVAATFCNKHYRKARGLVRQSLSQVLQTTGRPDVLVLGAGQAGLTAAVAAAQQGARVLVLEKLDVRRRQHVDELRAHRVRRDRRAGGRGHRGLGRVARAPTSSPPASTRTTRRWSTRYCREQLTTYRWLKDLGVEYGHVHAASGQSVPRSHSTDPSRMIDTLREAGRGARRRTSSTACARSSCS